MKNEVSRKKDIPVTRGDPRGVFYDLFDADEAAELTMRAELLRGLQRWLAGAGTQAAAAKVLGITQARVSDIKRGKIDGFSLDLLVRLASRAGLKPTLRIAA
jgi:predicted XRE-type DNA-binding protein